MIRSIVQHSDGAIRGDVAPAQWSAARAAPGNTLWIDLMPANGEEAEVERHLLEQFGFHPLAVEDALRQTHVPKLDDWREYIYLVLNAVTFDRVARKIKLHELDVFVGPNYLVTHHSHPIASLDAVWQSVDRGGPRLAHGTDYVLYQVIDALVAEYMPIVDELDDWIDEVEGEIFKSPAPKTLARIIRQKRRLVSLRRSLSALREVLNKLARDDYAVIDANDRVYFRDVYDHTVRLYDIVESMRDLVTGSLDTYLSVNANRTNEIMKTLTIVNAIFLPISFLAGFFGMNFFADSFAVQSASNWGWLLAPVVASILGLPAAMYYWMRRKRWM
jgi:magnesium transporter